MLRLTGATTTAAQLQHAAASAIAIDGAVYLANGGSFSDLDRLSDADWERMRAKIKAQNEKDRAGRSA